MKARDLLLAGAVCLSPLQVHADDCAKWAFPHPDAVRPEQAALSTRLAGSGKSYTPRQIDDLSSPPDWFPESHPAMPGIVGKGGQAPAFACASCHLTSGLGHPESADLAGLGESYILAQMRAFKNDSRHEPRRMNAIAGTLDESEMRAASAYFAELPRETWTRVVETGTVSKSFVDKSGMRLPVAGGGDEPLGDRIVELPDDPMRARQRDPSSGFTAYVPPGSVAKGQQLALSGDRSRAIAPCSSCHGAKLAGSGPAPGIAALSPAYVARQLCGFQAGARNEPSSNEMRTAIMNLSQADILDVAAYAASVRP